VACPTGIDIRDGLQLECVACAQCVDACDAVMTKINKPLGLIRYASQSELRQEPKKHGFRPRTILYPALIVALLTALIWLGRGSGDPKVTVLRGTGAPFVVEPDGRVRNQVRVKIHNRASETQEFHIALEGVGDSELIAAENPMTVEPDEMATTSVFVATPRTLFAGGRRAVELVVTTEDGFRAVVPYNLLGPQ
jgi:polyferredoxin